MAETPKDIYAPTSPATQKRPSVLILTADKTEDIEFFYPFYRFAEEGLHVDIATPKGGKFEGKQGLGLEESKKIEDVRESDYDLLYIPGGKAPEKLKGEDKALELVRAFVQSGKPVAAICHGAQLLAEADVVRGKHIAAWPDVEKEIAQAGGIFMNRETVTDGNFITGRWPGDLPSHVAETLKALQSSSQKGANESGEQSSKRSSSFAA